MEEMVQKYIASLGRVIKEIDYGHENLSLLCNKTSNILSRIYPDKNVNIAVGDQITLDLHGNEYYGKQELKQLITGYITELEELGLPPSDQYTNIGVVNNLYSSSNSLIEQENYTMHNEENINFDKIREFILELKVKLDLLELKVDTIGEILAELNTVETEIGSANPKTSILKESLNTIKAILIGITSNAYTPLILEKLDNLIK